MRRIAKKYGYELVTTLQSEQSSEGVRVSNSTLKQHEKNVKEKVDTPKKLCSLSNSVMTIDDKTPKSLTIQETLVLLRSRWRKGYEQDFDKLIMETRGCNLEEAERLREKWKDEGIISINPDGWLG